MLYKYEASDQEGAIEKGEFEAANKEAVVEYLRKKDLIPVLIEGNKESGVKFSMEIFSNINALDRIILVRNLAATVRAGLNIIESLDILINDATKKVMRDILVRAKANLQSGQALSVTFAFFKNFFPVIFVGILRAGEISGNLDKALEELGRHLSREYNLTKKVKSALAYPILLLLASIAVVVLLLVFIMPRLIKAFKQSGSELPGITKFVIGLSNVFTYSATLDILVLAFLVWFFVFFRKTAAGQKLFLKVIFKIPVAKELVKKVALVRFTRTLGSLISSGTPLIEAMNLSADSVGNEYYKQAILESVKQIKNGIPMSKTLEQFPELFPKFLTSLTAVGERTGTLEHILNTFSDFYDEEIDNSLKDLMTFLEPILLLIMGIVVGTIALSILLPIYKLVSKFR